MSEPGKTSESEPEGEGARSPVHDVDTDDAAAELGPPPSVAKQEPELFPGGTDAVRDEADYGDGPDEPRTRDLDPDDNPAVDDATPDDIKQLDDKQQEPDDEDREESGDETTEPSA